MTMLSRVAGLAALLALASTAEARPGLRLSSPALAERGRLPERQVADGMGCHGLGLSPALRWTGAPKGTRSFALTLYDPDAPTGSGWWHWVVYDLPAGSTGLAEGARPPKPAVEGRTDFGAPGYGGACPPAGAKPHRYVFTLYALDVERLGVPADASAAMVGFNLNGHTLAKTTLTSLYGR